MYNIFKNFKAKLLCVALFLGVATLALYADSYPEAYSGKRRLFDNAQLLSSGEAEDIAGVLERASIEDGANYIIVTTPDHQADNSVKANFTMQIYACNYFTDHGNNNGDGAILAISMKGRDVTLVTYGETDKHHGHNIDRIRSRIGSHLTNGQYHRAFTVFTELVRPPSYAQYFIMTGPFSLFLSILVTTIIIIYLLSIHKGTKGVTNKTYEMANSFDLVSTRDKYLRTSVSKTRISSNSGSRGSGSRGGGSRRSSSSGKF
jgi:uncharacterized protein